MEEARLSDTRPWYPHFDYWVRPNLNYPRRPLTDILRIAASDVPPGHQSGVGRDAETTEPALTPNGDISDVQRPKATTPN